MQSVTSEGICGENLRFPLPLNPFAARINAICYLGKYLRREFVLSDTSYSICGKNKCSRRQRKVLPNEFSLVWLPATLFAARFSAVRCNGKSKIVAKIAS